jgi:hypothetical protein
MYRENMSGFAEEEKKRPFDDINDSDDEVEVETNGKIVKAKRLELINSTIQEEEDGAPMIAYQNPNGTPIIFRNHSLADGEKLIIRIMGDLYIFSAKHAHLVASFIFALGLYKGATDITPLIIEFVGFLNNLKPDMFRVVTVTKFAFYATTAFSSVLFWMGYSKDSIQTNLLDKLDTKYPFKTAGVDNVIFNYTIGEHILKNIHMGVVIKDFYGALACISSVFNGTTIMLPKIVCDATTIVCTSAKQAFTNMTMIPGQLETILQNYFVSDDYSESEESEQTIATINSTQSIATINSTQSILSSKSIEMIMKTTNVESGSDPSSILDQIVQANDEIVDANIATVAPDLAGTEIERNNVYVSPLGTQEEEDFRMNAGKSRRKHNKKTHKKNKKTHKKNNKKSHKKQRRSKKH